MRRIKILIIISIAFLTPFAVAKEKYISHKKFDVGGKSLKLIVDMTRVNDHIVSEEFSVYRTVKFEVEGKKLFIGSVFDRQKQTANYGLFQDCDNFYTPLLLGGLGFYHEFNDDKWIILYDGKGAQEPPIFTKFYKIEIDNNGELVFKFVKHLDGAAIVSVSEHNGKYYASGLKLDDFYGAEIKFSEDSLRFMELVTLD